MTNNKAELVGREFDWFAQDNDANIGLFSTAGEGIVPAAVLEYYREHDDISDQIHSPNWGRSEVWADYAALGFFVFDWILPGGPYIRKHSPTKHMSKELKARLDSMCSIYSMPIKFAELTEIESV